MLNKALREAAKNELVVKNVVAAESAPKVNVEEMVIVKDVPGFVEAMRGHRFCGPAAIALFTGMRLGEVLALRWGRVDIDGKVIAVREVLEETKAHGIRSQPPKSKAGRRDLTLPGILVDALRDFRKEQLELRLKLVSESFRTTGCCSRIGRVGLIRRQLCRGPLVTSLRAREHQG